MVFLLIAVFFNLFSDFFLLLFLSSVVCVYSESLVTFSSDELSSIVTVNASNNDYLVLPTTLNLRQQISLNFRTCSSGTLLQQQGTRGDLFGVQITSDGFIRIYWTQFSQSLSDEVIIDDRVVNNNEWYSFNSVFRLGVITVKIESGQNILSSIELSTSTERSYLWDLQLSGGDLEVGKGLTGCLQEGPNVMFNIEELQATPTVVWGRCVMQDTYGCSE